MLRFDLLEVDAQGLEQDIRKHGDPVVFALPIADDDLAVRKIQVLDAQAHDFHETETAAIHDLHHQPVHTIHFCNDLPSLLPGKNRRDALRFCWTDGCKDFFVQLDIKHIAVEKQDGADCLILSRGRNSLLIDKKGDEIVNFLHTHLTGMALVVEEDILAHPADVGLFGTQGIMTIAQELAVLVEQFLGLSRRRDMRRR